MVDIKRNKTALQTQKDGRRPRQSTKTTKREPLFDGIKPNSAKEARQTADFLVDLGIRATEGEANKADCHANVAKIFGQGRSERFYRAFLAQLAKQLEPGAIKKKDSPSAAPQPRLQEDLDLEAVEVSISKALGIAMALSERPGDKHDSYAAEAITDYLHTAKKVLANEEVANG